MKIDLIIADRKRVAPHVGTYAELKLNLSSHQAEALGQATVRILWLRNAK